MASHLIGISGRKRSGKDTLAARLISHHGFTRVSFAEPMRAMLKAQNPIVDVREGESTWDVSYGEWQEFPGTPEPIHLTEVLGPEDDWETAKELPEVRRLMQALGTEAGRAILGENVWVDAAARVVDSIPGPVVITDVRFPNEADFVERWPGSVTYGLFVRVHRPGLPQNDLHPSETALDDRIANVRVINDGTIADLHRAADAIASQLGL